MVICYHLFMVYVNWSNRKTIIWYDISTYLKIQKSNLNTLAYVLTSNYNGIDSIGVAFGFFVHVVFHDFLKEMFKLITKSPLFFTRKLMWKEMKNDDLQFWSKIHNIIDWVPISLDSIFLRVKCGNNQGRWSAQEGGNGWRRLIHHQPSTYLTTRLWLQQSNFRIPSLLIKQTIENYSKSLFIHVLLRLLCFLKFLLKFEFLHF